MSGSRDNKQQGYQGYQGPSSGQTNQNQRLPFRPSAGNQGRYSAYPQYPIRPQKAYQASVAESENHEAPQEDQSQDQSYEGPSDSNAGYYANASDGGYPAEDFDEGFPPQEQYYSGNFFVATPFLYLDHQCSNCLDRFASKNKLFAHLRNTCWKHPRKPPADANATKVTTQANVAATEKSSADTDAFKESSTGQPLVIPSTSIPASGSGYAFRNYHYTVANLSWEVNGPKHEFCTDPGCTMSVMDRNFLPKHVEVKRMPSKIPIRGLGTDLHYSDEYAGQTFYLEGNLAGNTQNTPAFAKITREVHLVDNLKAGILMGADILIPEYMVMDFAKQQMTIGCCKDLITPISTRTRSAPIKRVIKSKDRLSLPPRSTTTIPVDYHGALPVDRDMLFEPKYHLPLGSGGIYAHIVDGNFSQVQASNDTDFEVVIPRKSRLGTVEELEHDGCFMVDAHHARLAAGGPSTWKRSVAKGFTAVALAAAIALPKPPAAASDASVSTAVTIDPSLERVMDNGVTIYERTEQAAGVLNHILDHFQDLFIDKGETVDIPEDQWMPIPLKPDATSKPARVYPVGQKDRDVIDATFGKLHDQGKMAWSTQPIPFSYPVFVVWRSMPDGSRKGRVVVDIRELNRVTETDTYPLPLQSDVIALYMGHAYISIVDAIGWFHQFRVQASDRHKLTVVIYRGQEQSAVALMGYKGSPPYVQRQTDAMLRPYPFTKAYMDDIIIFSHTLEEHVAHLTQTFSLFRKKRVSLSPSKSFIGYPSVTLLGQRVDGLGLSTSKEKIAAIAALDFPTNLRDLEIFLGLTGWLRQSIPRYAQRADSLQKRKLLLTRGLATGSKGPLRKRSATKVLYYEPTALEIKYFDDLKDAFASPTFLAYYDPNRVLFIDLDASKVWGLAAMIYHVKNYVGKPYTRNDIEPIMFLSKMLNAAETNYWPTELEVAGIIWVVRKVRHLIEASKQLPTIIYTDHSAAVPISRQTSLSSSSTDKLNLRLVRASQYLSQFDLVVKHKPGTSNVVPDALSRLRAATTSKHSDEGVLDALHVAEAFGLMQDATHAAAAFRSHGTTEDPAIYHATLVDMTDDFKNRLKQAYQKDENWKKIYDLLKPPAANEPQPSNERNQSPAANEDQHPTTEDPPAQRGNQDLFEEELTEETERPGICFVLRNELIYHRNGEGRLRLGVPNSMEQELFEQAHDLSSHGGFHRCYDRLSHTIYLRHLAKHLRTYIAHCPQCQLNQTKRHPPYGELVPIQAPSIPFHTIAMDFIVALALTSANHNTLLTMTCKFSKQILLVPGHDEWSAVKWAEVVLVAWLAHDWGIPRSIISDRDSRFMSQFWQEIFSRLGTKFLTATAYHPQTDGQSERTNQTVEIAMRYHLTANAETEWDQTLPFMQATINNSPSATTGAAPNEICYGFKVNNTVGMLSDLLPEDFNKLRLQRREEAEDSIAFASAMMKTRYDLVHQATTIKAGDRVYLRLHQGYKVPGITNRKLSQQRVGPFIVKRKVGQLAFDLDLPPVMRIHPVISIAQLEPKVPGIDPYGREQNHEPPPVITEDGEREYTVERLLDRRAMYGRVHYLVKWANYGNEHNVWYDVDDLQDAAEVVEQYDRRNGDLVARPTRQPTTRSTARVQVPEAQVPEAQVPEAQVPEAQAPATRAPIRPTRGSRPRGRPRGSR